MRNQFATMGCHKKLCDKGLQVQLFFGVSRFVLSGLITFFSLCIFSARRPQPPPFPENSFFLGGRCLDLDKGCAVFPPLAGVGMSVLSDCFIYFRCFPWTVYLRPLPWFGSLLIYSGYKHSKVHTSVK